MTLTPSSEPSVDMSGHMTDEDLVLLFYGESAQPAAVHAHLASCPVCAAEYAAIAETLALVPAVTPPERGDLYGLEVWQRLRPQLPARGLLFALSPARWRMQMGVAAAAVLAIAAFAAGRYWTPQEAAPVEAGSSSVIDTGAEDRARLMAIADHLERSERVLLDVTNADGPFVDVSSQQEWAAELVDANRLYREAATQAGDAPIATVLDDLERNLLDIVHAPSKLTPADLDNVRTRLDAAALLFKVRILSNDLRDRETAPVVPVPVSRKTT